LWLWCLLLVSVAFAAPRPTVLWHGMGDNCCIPESMGKIKGAIENAIPGIYVLSLEIGNIVEDELGGFIGNVNNQVDYVCQVVKADPNLQNGFNAVGFSQGGQFLRAYVQRCNDPPVHNLITMGGQHQGVADIPGCTSVNTTICSMVESLLELGAYNEIVQDIVVQAQYFHDTMDVQAYLAYNHFLTDINNELKVNTTYKSNLESLNTLLLVEFAADTVVVPRISSWFGFYEDGSTSVLVPYNKTKLYLEDRIGLRTLDEAKKLKFDSAPGNHMQFSLDWFSKHVIIPYLSN